MGHVKIDLYKSRIWSINNNIPICVVFFVHVWFEGTPTSAFLRVWLVFSHFSKKFQSGQIFGLPTGHDFAVWFSYGKTMPIRFDSLHLHLLKLQWRIGWINRSGPTGHSTGHSKRATAKGQQPSPPGIHPQWAREDALYRKPSSCQLLCSCVGCIIQVLLVSTNWANGWAQT